MTLGCKKKTVAPKSALGLTTPVVAASRGGEAVISKCIYHLNGKE
jgi:hypothetical protein